MKARGRPHNLQRLCAWVLKRGGRSDLMIIDFLAIVGLASCVRFSPTKGLPFNTD